MAVEAVSTTMPDRDVEALVRGYYESIDAGAYDRLARLLEPTFRHVRSDRTLEGRGPFVRFMRDERPVTDTTHEVDAVFEEVRDIGGDTDVLAVRGRLLRADGSVWFGFVDVFEVAGGRLAGLTTYTNGRDG